MCGIAGFLGTLDQAWLDQANRLQAHRGPDDRGTVWIPVDSNRALGLAHTRLAILDTSPLGHQPMAAAGGAVQLVFNGEIYNFRELRAELEAGGVRFCGHSDSEVLLQLYLQQGIACLGQLNGIFALAIWDGRSRQLHVARDAFGVKPLVWMALPGGCAFASEAKALQPLLALPDAREAADLDADALLRQLTYLWQPGAAGLRPALRTLEPGYRLCLDADAPADDLQPLCWSGPLPTGRHPGAPLLRNRAAAVAGTLAQLQQAVTRQMVADVPLGAFLSGGLDSSAVVALARQLNPQIECFTIASQGPQDGFVDDLPYARQVARHLGVPLQEVTVAAGDLAAQLRWMVHQLDAPLADPAPLQVFQIARAARAAGIKVLLSGAGGDDLFSGYRRHLALQSEALWGWWPRPLRRALRRWSAQGDQRSAVRRRLARLFAAADADPDQRLIHAFQWLAPQRLRPLLAADLQRRLSDPVADAPLRAYLAELPPGLTRLQRMLALEQRFFLADHNLLYTDKMSMAAGVEVRVPFLDPDLVAWSWQLPDQVKQRGRCGKWVLKQAMAPLLPQTVIHRPKTGFGAPLRRWLQHDLRELLAEQLDPARLRQAGLFDPAAVAALIEADRRGTVDAAYPIFAVLCTSLWWQQQQQPADVASPP
ncbi:MAG: asparagine synthase (glutamine-hydrolyzing) [Betaproteobacteria bacterium]|nr:asparagine synthase (glutamine-hydrolyzing) [Betaproteobacteria bacterium]MBM5808556.1 asparagine synthase (glutamine-hydrolyzing) [Cyanobacteria bacterium M_surface_9_m1_291]